MPGVITLTADQVADQGWQAPRQLVARHVERPEVPVGHVAVLPRRVIPELDPLGEAMVAEMDPHRIRHRGFAVLAGLHEVTLEGVQMPQVEGGSIVFESPPARHAPYHSAGFARAGGPTRRLW